MNIKTLVSVIIPCHNDGIYLKDAIDSLNAQTDKNFEIIIIDDASDDTETIKILDTLRQDGMQIIRLEKNSGPSVARNTGIKMARGDYILPLDADDKIAPTYLEKAKKILDTHKDMGIVYCEAEFFGLQAGKWPLPPYSFPEILIGNMIFVTAMYRKIDWETMGGYNENMVHGNEDYDFWLSILELGRSVYQIPEVLFSYRIKKHSRTTKFVSDHTNLLNSYVQMFHNHRELYIANIQYLFEELRRRQSTNQEVLTAQLFIDQGRGISEESSIWLHVAQNTNIQEFVFDLSDKLALTALRLDPLNDSCVIEIEKCTLITNHSEINLCEQITSNALIHHGNRYFFDHDDPQIYFNDLSLDKLDAKIFLARIRFVHIGKDAMRMCLNQITIDKDHIITSKEAELDQIKATVSWKLTRPLRTIK